MKKKLILCLLLIISLIITKNVYAETYDGEYSIEYLLRNYNLVTLGGEDLDLPNSAMPNYPPPKYTNGRVRNVTDIEGAILINGDFILDNASYRGTIGEKAGNTNSFIKDRLDNNITPATQIITDQNYIDFNKMYKSIIVESQALADKTEYHINNPKLEITKPGIYTIHNTAAKIRYEQNSRYGYSNCLLIKNYDSNGLYVFNYNNEYINQMPCVMIMEKCPDISRITVERTLADLLASVF